MNAKVTAHEEAIKNMLVERYLLGELSEDERDAFEAHFFDCPVCFDQIKSGTEFVSYLQRIGVEEEPASSRHGIPSRLFHPAFTMTIAAMFLCAFGFNLYQHSEIHRYQTPEVISVVTLQSASRGEKRVVTASRKGNFELRVLFQPNPDLTSWKAAVVKDSGKEVVALPISDPQTNELQLRFNTEPFSSGSYKLIIQGVDRTKNSLETVNEYPFDLQIKD